MGGSQSSLTEEELLCYQNNPFADRLCALFSSKKDGKLSFEDFLDMASVLSDSAPIKVKADYSFVLYDEDEDGMLSRQDIAAVVSRLTGRNQLAPEQMTFLLDKVMAETDLDEDSLLSRAEYEHVVRKVPDFCK
ncbi:CIB1 [Cordylochernes scorpioides]|uniref:CIB1 n=1 Tax=Cordylochernes scorpioides TaxID=51811 RepID=A0ABY6KZG9_9ARAC|nr:CIB1 [Cordylochernes scorpioides]